MENKDQELTRQQQFEADQAEVMRILSGIPFLEFNPTWYGVDIIEPQ